MSGLLENLVIEMAALNLPRGRPDSCDGCCYKNRKWQDSPCGYCRRATLDFWKPGG